LQELPSSYRGSTRATQLAAQPYPAPPPPPPPLRAPAPRQVNAGGLEGLYELLLDSARPEWVAALQRVLVAAERGRPVLFFCKAGKDRTVRGLGLGPWPWALAPWSTGRPKRAPRRRAAPAARTQPTSASAPAPARRARPAPQGILAALLLSLLGATDDQIVADYVKSDSWHHMALAGIENDSRIATLDRAKFERAPAEAMRHALQVRPARGGGHGLVRARRVGAGPRA
jgi:hypothetical protein